MGGLGLGQAIQGQHGDYMGPPHALQAQLKINVQAGLPAAAGTIFRGDTAGNGHRSRHRAPGLPWRGRGPLYCGPGRALGYSISAPRRLGQARLRCG